MIKKSSNTYLLAFILFIISIFISTSVAIVSNITSPIIIGFEESTKINFFSKTFPNSNNFKNITHKINDKNLDIIEIYQVNNNKKIIGYIYIVSTIGYSDKIKNFIAIDSNRNIIKSINILQQNETPGLGDKATDINFKNQYSGINTSKILTINKTSSSIEKGEIQAITSATITSKSITNGVNAALENYNKYFKNRSLVDNE